MPRGRATTTTSAGARLSHLAVEARRELMEAAWDYTRSYRDVPLPPMAPDTPLLLAGHQPQLFHPGVWFKNFVLGRLAQQSRRRGDQPGHRQRHDQNRIAPRADRLA